MVGLFSALICVPLIWFSVRLKHVSIDEQFLYIEDGGGNELKVPLGQISDVSQTNWIKPYPVTIHLRENGPAGNKILFIPAMHILKGARRHPIVEELNALARQSFS
jgi:hypothetical protein